MKYFRQVFKIKAEHSPNVRLAIEERARGIAPTGRVVTPGVLSWDEYLYRRATWDVVRQCIGLDAEFWEGKDVLMFPPEWLNRAEEVARTRPPWCKGMTTWMGCDPAQGGDKTAWCIIDQYGVVDLVSIKTPDTNMIVGHTILLMSKYKTSPENVRFDVGGGGQQHSDRLRAMGYDVETVAFGEAIAPPPRRNQPGIWKRKEEKEEKSIFTRRRAQMYWMVRLKIDPAETPEGFAIPAEFVALRQQLGPIPLTYDGESKIDLPPKQKRNPQDTKPSLTELIGHSPDEADALALAVYAKEGKPVRVKAGVVL